MRTAAAQIPMALVAAFLLMSACTQSEIPSSAAVTIGGTLQGQNGAPVAGGLISLSKQNPGENLAAVFSLGVYCLASGPSVSVCRTARRAQSDETGRFAYHLRGSDTQGFGASADTMILSGGRPRPGTDEIESAISTLRFVAQTTTLSLDLRLWEPVAQAASDGRTVTVSWPAFPAGLAAGVSGSALKTAVLFQDRDGRSIWTIDRAGRDSGSLDARVLEDSRGTLAVSAESGAIRVPDSQGRTVALVFRSGLFPYASDFGPPLSRGRPCAVADARGAPVAQTPCGLTDGDLVSPFEPRTCPAEAEASCSEPSTPVSTIDLGNVTALGLIVVRGCGACTLETSADGRAWRHLAEGSGDDVAVPARGKARFVRFSATGIPGVREVSVWSSAAPALVAAHSLRTDPRSILGGGTSRTRPSRSSGVWPVAAAGFVLAASGALVFVVRRRRLRRPPSN